MTSTFNNIYIKDKTFFLEDLVEFYGIQNSLLSLIFCRRRQHYDRISGIIHYTQLNNGLNINTQASF